MENTEEGKKNRIFYLDILRTIACLSVILTHVSTPFVESNIGSFNFWVGDICDGISRIGVPLFVMISGALMLDKNYKYSSQKLVGHIKKLVVFFIFWSSFYAIVCNFVIEKIIRHEWINVMNIVKSFLIGPFHFWYIYLIIGLYLILPLLRLWVKDENKKYVEYFIFLSIIFSFILPQIVTIGSYYNSFFEHFKYILEKELRLTYVGGFIGYYILGWYLNNYDIKNKKVIYFLGILGMIISIVGTYIISNTTGMAIQLFDNLSINILIPSIAVYIFIKDKYKNVEGKSNKIINSISKYSLGIYAMHVLFYLLFARALGKINIYFCLINIPVLYGISFLFSYLGTIIFNKIPFFRKLV